MHTTHSKSFRRQKTPEVVKSAIRALEILEFFDRWQQPASVGLIASDLGYPQSSSSALMRSLVKVGYLTYDSATRRFMPTARVSLLGKWVSDSFLSEGPVLEIARQIADRVGCAVGLGRRNFDKVQWIHAVPSETLSTPEVFGLDCNLSNSAIGTCMLATLDDSQVRGVMHRMNADVVDLDEVIPPSQMLSRVAIIRRDGYALDRMGEIDMLAMSTLLGGIDDCIAIALLDNTGALSENLTGIVDIAREALARISDCEPAGAFPLRPANRFDGEMRMAACQSDQLVAQF